MKVAVLTGIDVGGIGLELSYRLVCRREVTAQNTVRSYELNELDVVFRSHRVLY